MKNLGSWFWNNDHGALMIKQSAFNMLENRLLQLHSIIHIYSWPQRRGVSGSLASHYSMAGCHTLAQTCPTWKGGWISFKSTSSEIIINITWARPAGGPVERGRTAPRRLCWLRCRSRLPKPAEDSLLPSGPATPEWIVLQMKIAPILLTLIISPNVPGVTL